MSFTRFVKEIVLEVSGNLLYNEKRDMNVLHEVIGQNGGQSGIIICRDSRLIDLSPESFAI